MSGEPIEEIPSIAIIGLACRFPGADNPEEFWRNLREGKESISRFTQEELEAAGADMRAARDPRYIPARAILRGGCDFDAGFFGYSAREAELMDPQHRVFLECAWEAMENAGYTPDAAPVRVGVFAGGGTNTYLFRNLIGNPEVARSADGFQIFLGNDKDFIPTRVSYKLNLRGAGVSVSTACSTSLTAVHFACQALLTFQCDIALAGAVSIQSPEKEGYLYQEGGINSADGHCRAFDADSDGTVGGCGAGIVVLRRLEDALAADSIRAIIRGTAVNNDGSAKIGYTAPSVAGQAEVVTEALDVAGVHPDSVSYVEAHGTGTSLGDPIEIEALTRAFSRGGTRESRCAIGSVKTNIGHLDAAAGIAGLIKTILALEHREIPATLHFRTPNPRIGFEKTPFRVNDVLRPWDGPAPRRAGVSSFGIGGTNAHVVLEEAPVAERGTSGPERHVFPVSARTPEALSQAVRNLSAALASQPGLSAADVAFTLQTGRKSFPWRTAVVSSTLPEMLTLPAKSVQDRPVAFLFPGQGAQRPRMGEELYRSQPVFRDAVDRCATLLKPRLGLDLRDALYPRAGTGSLGQTQFAQPALFAVEYALVELVRSLGIEPAAMIGHSFGEYLAACVAGVFTLEQALDLVMTRASLMAGLPLGEMLAVPLSSEEIAPWLNGHLEIAAANGPSRTVVSGSTEAISGLESALKAAGFASTRLASLHAFHSRDVDGILDGFREAVARIPLQAPRIRYISNLTGDWIGPAEATDPNYWVLHMRHTVRFGQGLACLLADPDLILLELGPGRELTAMARRLPECGGARAVLPLLSPGIEFPDVIAKAWTAGARIDWSCLHRDADVRRVALPTYPFERRRYYIRPETIRTQITGTRNEDPKSWLYTPSWVRRAVNNSNPISGPWLIVGDSAGLGSRLASLLAEATLIPSGVEQLPEAPRGIVYLATGPEDGLSDFDNVFHLVRRLGAQGMPQGLRLHLVSPGVHDVTGDEAIDPRKAAMLAFVRVASQEYPGLVCRSIDVKVPRSEAEAVRLAANLVAELAGGVDTPFVAWRGRHRWEQSIQPLDDKPPALHRKQRDTWLITGGTSGLGLEFAEHLARTTQANLVLVSRSLREKTPPIVFPAAAAEAMREQIEARLGIRGLDSYPGLAAELNALCCMQIGAFFRERGLEPAAGLVVNSADLARDLGVLPKFEKFVRYFLRVLRDDDIVDWTGDRVEFLKSVPDGWQAQSLDLQRRFPGFAPIIGLLHHSALHFGRALTGGIEAISVLFPDGKSGLMLEAGRDTVEHLDARVYRTLLKEMLQEAVRNAVGRKLRILEIGGGHGVLTGEILSVLAEANVEYSFTDLGKAFVVAARARAEERRLDFMKFQVLDITEPSGKTGLEPESFDLILGLDVVHATPNIAKTLSNLRLYLRPGGSLALLETLRVARWNEMIFGLTEGWWYFEDPEIRVPGSPILSIDSWLEVLKATGYTGLEAWPKDPRRRSGADSGMLLARKPGRIETMRELGSQVLTEAADVSDAVQMGRVEALAVERFGGIDGILHCAAVDDQGSIQWKTPRFEEREFAPKIRGTEVLEGIVERTQPSVFLLCSSLNTATGGPGQIGYCAANAFLDAYAHSRAGAGRTRTVSVNWDRWQSIGMASAFEDWTFRRTGRKLEGGMTVAQGLAILDRILWAETPAQVIVSKSSPIAPRTTAEPLQSSLQNEAKSEAVARQATNPPVGPVETVIASVFESTLGGGPIGRDGNFTELGGDSLIAIQVVSRLREELQVELPLRSIFENPSVAGLAEAVANRRWATEAAPAEAEMEEGVI